MLVVQDTNPAVRVDGVYAFVVFASCELGTEIRGLAYSGDGNG